MAISFTRTFANLTSALLSYLDDNFNDINTFLGSATGVQTSPAVNKIPLATANAVLEGWSQGILANAPGLVSQGVGTGYYSFVGGTSSTEADTQTLLPCAVVVKKLAFQYLSSNSLSQNSVVTIRKNGVDTALTVTIPAGSTAIVIDSTHSVSFAQGDLISLKVVISGGTGSALRPAFSVILSGV